MDPSNNNSFDSFGSNAGAGNGTGVGTGAGVGSGVAITSSNSSSTTNPGPIVSGGVTAVNNYSSKNFPDGGITIGGGENRSRKGLIIAGAVFFVLAIGGGLAALAAMNGAFGGGDGGNGGGGGNTPAVVIDENVSMEVAFNRYANYLVSGEVKDEAVESETFISETKLNEEFINNDYINNLKMLFDIFNEKIAKIDSSYKPVGDLSRIQSGIGLLIEADNIESIDEDQLQKIYLAEGVEAALGYIDGFKNDSLSEDDYLISFLEEKRIKYEQKVVEQWELYKKYGCIIESQFDSDCISSISETEYYDNMIELGDISVELDSYFYDIVQNIKLSSSTINDYLKGRN